MQDRLVKTIRATLVTRIEFDDPERYLSDSERMRLDSVRARFESEIDLRRAGLTPRQIDYLEFVRWSHRQS